MGASNGPWGCSWYAKSGLYIFLNRSGRCAAACDADILWSQKDKKLTEAWIAVFATVCLVSVAVAILTILKPRKQPILITTAGENSLAKCRNISYRAKSSTLTSALLSVLILLLFTTRAITLYVTFYNFRDFSPDFPEIFSSIAILDQFFESRPIDFQGYRNLTFPQRLADCN